MVSTIKLLCNYYKNSYIQSETLYRHNYIRINIKHTIGVAISINYKNKKNQLIIIDSKL